MTGIDTVRPVPRSAPALHGAAALARAAAGCGSNSDSTSGDTVDTVDTGGTETTDTAALSGTPQTEPVNEIDVSETEFTLAPSPVQPASDDGGPPTTQANTGKVTFHITNDGTTTHSFVFNNLGNEEEIPKPLAPGDSTDLTVDVPSSGFYEYYCPIDGHQDQGMQGQLEVVD